MAMSPTNERRSVPFYRHVDALYKARMQINPGASIASDPVTSARERCSSQVVMSRCEEQRKSTKSRTSSGASPSRRRCDPR